MRVRVVFAPVPVAAAVNGERVREPFLFGQLVGCENLSRRQNVPCVNHTTETVATVDTNLASRGRDRCAPWLWRHERQCSMGPVFVVVGHEHIEGALKVLLVQNQHPVETFRAGRAHKPLGRTVCLRRPKRRANDLHAIAAEHRIEAVREFLTRSRIKYFQGFLPVSQRPRQLPCLLRHRRPARIGCASRHVHTTTAQLNEEEDVEPLEPDRPPP